MDKHAERLVMRMFWAVVLAAAFLMLIAPELAR